MGCYRRWPATACQILTSKKATFLPPLKMPRYDEGDISILVRSGHFYFGTTDLLRKLSSQNENVRFHQSRNVLFFGEAANPSKKQFPFRKARR
jgi:hypothetical protein